MSAMQSLTESLGSGARESDVASRLMTLMERQAELLQEVLQRERELQTRLVERAFAPWTRSRPAGGQRLRYAQSGRGG